MQSLLCFLKIEMRGRDGRRGEREEKVKEGERGKAKVREERTGKRKRKGGREEIIFLTSEIRNSIQTEFNL